jgi:hypothetical protein
LEEADTLRFRVPLLQVRLSILPEQLPEKETDKPPAKMESLCPLWVFMLKLWFPLPLTATEEE